MTVLTSDLSKEAKVPTKSKAREARTPKKLDKD